MSFLAKALQGLLQRFARSESGTLDLTHSGEEDRSLREAIARASKLQKDGLDIGFRFLHRSPDMPPLVHCTGTYRGAEIGFGFDPLSHSTAFVKALSETVERVLWKEFSVSGARIFESAYKDAPGGALDPRTIAGFSDAQKAKEPRLQCDDTTVLRWIEAKPITAHSPRSVPLQMISGFYGKEVREKQSEPLLAQSTTNGLATHRSFDEACHRGLLELIERDAFAITYFNRISPARIDPSSITDTRVKGMLAELARYDYSYDLLLLPSDMPVSIVLAIVRDETSVGPALGVGARADADASDAIYGALSEALMLHARLSTSEHKDAKLPPYPWSMKERLIFWAKNENTEKLSWLWRGALVPCPTGTKRSFAGLVAELEKKQIRVSAVELSDARVRDVGLHTAFVLSPDLQPIDLDTHPPYDGGVRLKKIPELFGYTARSEPPEYPHPFP